MSGQDNPDSVTQENLAGPCSAPTYPAKRCLRGKNAWVFEDEYLSLVLQVLLLLLPHDLQLLSHLDLSDSFGLLGLSSTAFALFFAEGVESGAGVAHLEIIRQR